MENLGRDGNRLVAAETVALLRLERNVGAGEGGRGEKTEILGEGGAGESEPGEQTPRGFAGLAQERLADILGLSKIRHSGGGGTFGELIILTDVLQEKVREKCLDSIPPAMYSPILEFFDRKVRRLWEQHVARLLLSDSNL